MSGKAKNQGRRGTKNTRPRRARPLLWLALPTLIFLPLVLLSTFWYLPTRIQLDLTTARLAFTLGGDDHREILDHSVTFSALTIERCSSVTFTAEKLAVADPLQDPATAWHELIPTNPVKLVCRDPAAKLTLPSPDPAATRLGTLADLRVAPGSQVILEISSDREPTLTLDIETPQQLSLPLDSKIELVTSFLALADLDLPVSSEPLTFRAQLPEPYRQLELTSSERGLVVILTPPRDQLTELFLDKLELPLSSVQLLEEDLKSRLISPLRAEATLSYPNYPGIDSVTLAPGDFIDLEALAQIRLRTLAVDPEKSGLHVILDGIVGQVSTHAAGLTTDRRLTLFHTFRYSWRWEALVLIAVWLIPTTWAAYEVFRTQRE